MFGCPANTTNRPLGSLVSGRGGTPLARLSGVVGTPLAEHDPVDIGDAPDRSFAGALDPAVRAKAAEGVPHGPVGAARPLRERPLADPDPAAGRVRVPGQVDEDELVGGMAGVAVHSRDQMLQHAPDHSFVPRLAFVPGLALAPSVTPLGYHESTSTGRRAGLETAAGWQPAASSLSRGQRIAARLLQDAELDHDSSDRSEHGRVFHIPGWQLAGGVVRVVLLPGDLAQLGRAHDATSTGAAGRWSGRLAMKASRSLSRTRRDRGPSRTLGSMPVFSRAYTSARPLP